MARTGRPPTPLEVKRKRGTLRKDRVPGGTSLAVVPAIAPGPLDGSLQQVTERVLAQGVPWLSTTDSPTLKHLDELLEERELLRDAVLSGGGDRKHLREIDKQVIELLSKLGFDPAARSRLGLAEVKAASKLEEIRARKQASDKRQG